jgi:hypothetical protein
MPSLSSIVTGKKAGERQQVQMPASQRATPVEQPEDEAGRPRYGNEQRVQRERAADDLRPEPATALRCEPVTNWHEHGQRPQPADEHKDQQPGDRLLQPPAHVGGVAAQPLR